ncbi:spidroin-2-like [Motacilla alba alba]|uniref:spidroin-2-like n=1 Tax=Motacilla alba alba TaxID=1094192 RepID=UPI0018D4E137|nr:spidroin-2-like [Motacilla alba alba]
MPAVPEGRPAPPGERYPSEPSPAAGRFPRHRGPAVLGEAPRGGAATAAAACRLRGAPRRRVRPRCPHPVLGSRAGAGRGGDGPCPARPAGAGAVSSRLSHVPRGSCAAGLGRTRPAAAAPVEVSGETLRLLL